MSSNKTLPASYFQPINNEPQNRTGPQVQAASARTDHEFAFNQTRHKFMSGSDRFSRKTGSENRLNRLNFTLSTRSNHH